MFPPLRDVIESDDFRTQCAEVEADVQRLDEQLQGVIWAVARQPDAFTRVVGDVYVVETFGIGADSEYVFIFFTIDDEKTCTLRWLTRGSSLVDEESTTLVRVP